MRALSVAATMAATLLATTQARPMHAAITPHYTRYLEERSDVQVELDAWMHKFADAASKNGWLPPTESRSADEQQEDQLQRFFLTKEKIKSLELENPDAQFSTDSPFSLLTDDEFHTYVGNAYRKAEDATRKLRTGQGDRGQRRSGNRGKRNNNSGGGGRSSWSHQRSSSTSDVASDSDITDTDRSTTWSGVVPAHWVDWWNAVTENHSNNNNYRPETVAPFNPDAPQATDAPATDAPAATDAPDTSDNNDNSLPVGPVAPEDPPASNEDNILTQAPDSNAGYDFNAATSAPVAAESDTTNGAKSALDWSTSPCNAPIQNQGQCGSCWAFASVAAVESAQCIAGGQRQLTKYSEQQLASCDRKNFGCNGGAPVYAFEYIQQNGLCTADAFPYASSNGRNAACATNCQKADVGVKGYAKVTGEDGLLTTLASHPVVVAVAAGNNAWKQYAGGVLSACDTTQVDHAVLAIGFDAETIKIKNSWGTRWGEAGYIRLKRSGGQGTCGVYTDMSHPLV